jgi:hypothetical protein
VLEPGPTNRGHSLAVKQAPEICGRWGRTVRAQHPEMQARTSRRGEDP